MAQRDVVLRWIEQLARVIARLIKGGTAGDLDLARAEIQRATAELLGPLAALVPQLDAPTAAEILADPDRVFAWAQLLDLDGIIAEATGNAEAGVSARSRALLLAEEACRRSRIPRSDWKQWVDDRRQT
jgi:hypothetical protein